ncbi:MAG: hypothetical protein D6702_00615 [Planctomycetota bacterium]|nr:MAG: hypothetical protein D6702_00615 [Planctomycetota bacterium]
MPDDSPAPLAVARRLQAEGRFLAAAELLLAAFRRDPASAEVAEDLGELMLAAGDPGAALDFFQRARHADPVSPRALRGCLEALRLLGRRDEAARVLLVALEGGLDEEAFGRQFAEPAAG